MTRQPSKNYVLPEVAPVGKRAGQRAGMSSLRGGVSFDIEADHGAAASPATSLQSVWPIPYYEGQAAVAQHFAFEHYPVKALPAA